MRVLDAAGSMGGVHISLRQAKEFLPMSRRARVLVIDDDLACRVLAALLLEKAGYSPTAVGSVERGLERLEDEGADVVVTDLLMPDQSGLDLLLALRDRQSAVPVIVMTGSDDLELLALALELGAASVLRKPYSPEALSAAVSGALLRERPEAA
jgi:two-component system response regulator HydG